MELSNLIQLKQTIEANPRVRRKELLSSCNLTKRDLENLINKNILRRSGRTKGVSFYWGLDVEPDYRLMSYIEGSSLEYAKKESIISVVTDMFDVIVRVSPGVTLTIKNDNEVILSKDNKEKVTFTDPQELKTLLNFLQ